MNAVGMYLYLLRALSDEQHELLEDNQIFTAFVARYRGRRAEWARKLQQLFLW